MERQDADFEILKTDNNGRPKYRWMYLDSYSTASKQKGYISYRHFICYALHNMLHRDINEDDCKQKLQSFKKAYEEGKEYGYKDNNNIFLEIALYHKTGDNHGDFLILDKTKGCYPLTLHQNKNYRDSEFEKALVHVTKKIEEILPFLKKHKDWDSKLEESLDKIWKSK